MNVCTFGTECLSDTVRGACQYISTFGMEGSSIWTRELPLGTVSSISKSSVSSISVLAAFVWEEPVYLWSLLVSRYLQSMMSIMAFTLATHYT